MNTSVNDDIFGGARSLPTSVDLYKVARDRRIGWKDIKGKGKEGLSNILNIPLIFNPNYRGLQRPDNYILRMVGTRSGCSYWATCCRYKKCRLTIVRDTASGEEFYFHSMKHAYKALGTRDDVIIKPWGFEFCYININ